jgi:glycosyltransferase involved in cell wall biosynthesis
VDQWVPTLHEGDAIGDSARLMRRALRAWGHEADIFALEVDERLRGEAMAYGEWRPGGPQDVVLFHYALPSPLTEGFRRASGRRILLHHNITPPEFFLGYDPEMARICRLGQEQLASLRDCADLGLADSEFNRLELERAGFGRTGVLPIYLDFARYREPPNRVLLNALRDGRTNLLFVGRVAPNKRHEDLIRLVSVWKRYISSDVRLLLVGKLPRRRHYLDALQALMYEEGLTPWEVVFTGHVEHDDLLACYAAADLFVSMSEHEGFGLPLVEAMLMNVPILALWRGSGARHAGRSRRPVLEQEPGRGRGGGPPPRHGRGLAAGRAPRTGAAARGLLSSDRGIRLAHPPGVLVSAAAERDERPEIAFVIQRYGPDVAGGAESLARAVAGASRRGISDHGVHDLRARLRHLEERAERGERERLRRGSAALPHRGGAGSRLVQPPLGPPLCAVARRRG